LFDIEKIDRSVELFIFDIYIAVLKIKEVIKNFDDAQALLHDFRSWDSVIREFEIIGEASKYLLKAELLDKEYQQVVDFRNKITHEYFGIDADEIWDISFDDLKQYETVILKLIESMNPLLRDELVKSFIEDNRYLDFVVKALEQFNEK
jgi:uncharacterized protein with HEPN domain